MFFPYHSPVTRKPLVSTRFESIIDIHGIHHSATNSHCSRALGLTTHDQALALLAVPSPARRRCASAVKLRYVMATTLRETQGERHPRTALLASSWQQRI
ncbi:uncharacterized protein LACBIDRAFT_317920 [Laccaria bicolor S238N-H82]|uniref:Predicted protein n=1 Tax=Laccaria bicolor (strain S238N-H82 / ATCC MYA-4686) TaxID=486041 RepID=B0D5I6_LACBS|nr:uncharacterized protein LACBIDRAFT_317920 [Laccaria bicolor S238N-H82]EDR10029.1 predicted protein [Laccaria bicolor S238N-H82]|eukprot:XP_001879414.1 predicted protein [Laccaria bicolor S238N-H82]